MSIILNEIEWAEQAVKNKDLGKKPYETLCRVAKYYTSLGYSKPATRKMLDSFLLQCDPDAPLGAWSDTLDRLMRKVSKYPPVVMDGVGISKQELDIIGGLKGVQLQRLAFTLLCVSKYNFAINPNTNHWVGNSDKEIMKLANINTSIKRQSYMFSQLHEAGLIGFSKKIDNLSVQVLFSTDGDPGLYITDFRNLGYQYMKHLGAPDIIECENCGVTIKVSDPSARGRKKKYCHDCAIEIKTKQNVNAVMRLRYAMNK